MNSVRSIATIAALAVLPVTLSRPLLAQSLDLSGAPPATVADIKSPDAKFMKRAQPVTQCNRTQESGSSAILCGIQ
jgi:hypothetical protein